MNKINKLLYFAAAHVLGCTITLAVIIPTAFAQSSVQSQTFDITLPAQTLAAALAALSKQTGIQIYAAGELVAGKQTQALSGRYTVSQALTLLLSSSGLDFTPGAAGGFVVQRAPVAQGEEQMPEIKVQASNLALPGELPKPYAGGQVARGGALGILGNRDMMDTPFNQTNYTAKTVEDKQARTLLDVIGNNPSVQTLNARNGSNVDNFSIRGFSYQSVLFGGLPGMLGTDGVMPELAERIEVLTGPSAMLNGNVGMGGTVNIVPKRASEESLTRFTPTYGSTRNLGGSVDIGRRFGSEKQFGVRFNGVYRDGETAVKDISDQRGLASLGLDFRGERLRLSADLGYQQQYLQGVIPRMSLGAGVPVLGAPDTSRNPGMPWSSKDQEDKFGVIRGEFDVTEKVSVYAAGGHHDWQRTFLLTRLTVNNANGNAAGATVLSNYHEQHYTGDMGVRARFDTGSIGHELTVGARNHSLNYEIGETAGPNFTTNIYAPSVVAKPNLALPERAKFLETRVSSLAIADTLSVLDKRIQLSVGARQQKIETTNFQFGTGIQTSRSSKTGLSPFVGLVVKPLKNVSLFGNVIHGLEPGEIVGQAFANVGTAFPPYKTKQYEAGVKVDWGTWATTASVFDIARPSVLTDVAANTRVLNGEQRNRGLELNVFGEPSRGLRLLGGVMFLDGVLTKTQGGLNDGLTAPAAPKHRIVMGGEWDTPFAPGFTLTGRLTHVALQYIDGTRPQRAIPAWDRFDIGARYSLNSAGKPTIIRLSVENVFNKDYWESGLNNQMMPAMPRTVFMSATVDF